MTSDISTPTHDYSSSAPTVESVRSRGILELGKKLVAELQLDQSVDTLGRWMAHYIAELIEQAEHAEANEREDAQSRCFDAILKLWNHRRAMPSGRRPFEDVEPILRALASLDPDETGPRYFRSGWGSEQPKKEQESEAEKWLGCARGVDHTARLLIRYCLARAAETALDKSKDWVKLAEAAGQDDDVEGLVVRIVTAEEKLLDSEPMEDVTRKVLKERIERLDQFINMASALSQEFQMTLGEETGPTAEEAS